MVQATLEERLYELEKTFASIISGSSSADVKKHWRDVVGFFDDDPIAKAIDEEGRKIRQADRQQSGS
ncbi:MAG: hypothetical protein V2J55_19455 [Candidatus Competibacteraceae bacterium]|nr:hypothetical protein [Candidatus Competibacteraceae bacterium]